MLGKKGNIPVFLCRGFIDDFCGTRPGNKPTPPGPGPWGIVALMMELGALASALPAGGLRDRLDEVNGQLGANLAKSFASR